MELAQILAVAGMLLIAPISFLLLVGWFVVLGSVGSRRQRRIGGAPPYPYVTTGDQNQVGQRALADAPQARLVTGGQAVNEPVAAGGPVQGAHIGRRMVPAPEPAARLEQGPGYRGRQREWADLLVAGREASGRPAQGIPGTNITQARRTNVGAPGVEARGHHRGTGAPLGTGWTGITMDEFEGWWGRREQR